MFRIVSTDLLHFRIRVCRTIHRQHLYAATFSYSMCQLYLPAILSTLVSFFAPSYIFLPFFLRYFPKPDSNGSPQFNKIRYGKTAQNLAGNKILVFVAMQLSYVSYSKRLISKYAHIILFKKIISLIRYILIFFIDKRLPLFQISFQSFNSILLLHS